MGTAVLGLRVLLSLAVVLGLIWVVARRAGWGKGARRPAGPTLEVVGRQALGRHVGVAVVAVGDRRLLLGYGEQQVTMLTELDRAPAEESEPAAPAARPAVRSATRPAVRSATRPATRTAAARTVVAPTTSRIPAQRSSSARPPVAAADAAPAQADGAPAPDAEPAVPATAAEATTAAEAAYAAAAAALAATSHRGATPVPGLEGVRVADVDPADLLAPAAGGERPRRSALDGSILAPATWRQALASLQDRTVRR